MAETSTATLGDDLERAVLGKFYTHHNTPNCICKIISFGSQCCEVQVYDKKTGKFLGKDKIRTEDRRAYIRVPESELPERLKEQ